MKLSFSFDLGCGLFEIFIQDLYLQTFQAEKSELKVDGFPHLWGHFDWVACFDYFCPYARVKKLALMKLALNDLSTAFFAVLVQHFGNPSVRLQLDCEPFVTVAVFSDNAFESHIWK